MADINKAIIFVGGFAAPGQEWGLSPIRKTARQEGWTTEYHHQRLMFGPISQSALRLKYLCKTLGKQNDTIIVVGHSMGGLVAEHAATLNASIDGIVTIATPHQGARLAGLGFLFPTIWDMRPESEYLKRQAALGGTRPPLLAIEAQWDHLVPNGVGRPTRPHSHLSIDRAGHLGVIFRQATADAIVDWAEDVNMNRVLRYSV